MFTVRDDFFGAIYGLVSEGEQVDPDDPDSFRVTELFAPAMQAWLDFENSPENRLRQMRNGISMMVDMYAGPDFYSIPGVVSRVLDEEFSLYHDIVRLVEIAGCESPTTLQFMVNLRQMAVGGPTLQDSGHVISGSLDASDPAPVLGQHNSVGEVCWAASGWGWQVSTFCLCAGAEADKVIERVQPDELGRLDYNSLHSEALAGGSCNAFRE